MSKTIKSITITIVLIILSSCSSYNTGGYRSYNVYTWDRQMMYPEDYDGYYQNYPYNEQTQYQEKKQVVVPNSYHVGQYHSPRSHKDRDQAWVNQQRPYGYTIEIAEGTKASTVAKKLNKAPKNDRRAEIKYYKNGQTHYKGLYGSFPTREAAQKAYENLPTDVKSGASIQSWGNIQSTGM